MCSGIAASTLVRIVSERSAVSPERALRLSKALGRSPESWLTIASALINAGLAETLASLRNEPRFQQIAARLEKDTATQLEAIRALPNMGKFDLRSGKSD
jgi:plasmid maintenance system antidote protein VapI